MAQGGAAPFTQINGFSLTIPARDTPTPEPALSPLRRLMLIVPLLALPAAPGLAAELSAAEGLEILAMAKTADSRCKVLSRSEHAELASYESRAEMAALTLLDRGTRSKAIAAGKARGRSVTCSASLARDIRDTLGAAREAVAQADRSQPQAEPRRAAVAPPQGQAAPLSLAAYGTVIRPYYADLRCRSLGKAEAARYWRAIVRLQRGMVAKFGASAVAAAQARARGAAQRLGCQEVATAAAAGIAQIENR